MKIRRKSFQYITCLFFGMLSLATIQASGTKEQNSISLSCKKDNDLYITLKQNKIPCIRYDTPEEAINNADRKTGVLILADNYPLQTTVIGPSLYQKARDKKLRLY